MAMIDAGVPVKSPVAGTATGITALATVLGSAYDPVSDGGAVRFRRMVCCRRCGT
jgi:hypothetical protein